MKRNKIYIVYKIIDRINNKEYIGVHGTFNVNDNYMGSSNLLKLQIFLKGPDNFDKKIIHVFETKDEAYKKEAELVNEEYVQREDTYNIKLGGEGGWDNTWESNKRPEIIEKRREGQRRAVREGRLKPLTPEARRKGQLAKGMLGKNHTDETKKKISENNGSNLDRSIIQSRIEDYIATEKKWGYIAKLSNKWEISHTQVRRFLKQNGLV